MCLLQAVHDQMTLLSIKVSWNSKGGVAGKPVRSDALVQCVTWHQHKEIYIIMLVEKIHKS